MKGTTLAANMGELRESFEEARRRAGVSTFGGAVEHAWHWPEEVATGVIRKVAFDDTFDLFYDDHVLMKNLCWKVEMEPSPLELSFQISGSIRSSMGKRDDLGFSPGQCGIFYSRCAETVTEQSAGQRIAFLIVRVVPDQFCRLLNCDPEELPPGFRSIFTGLPMKKEIDATITRLLATRNVEERQTLYAWLLRTLHEQAVYLPITGLTTMAIHGKRVRGVHFGPTIYAIPFEDMDLDPTDGSR